MMIGLQTQLSSREAILEHIRYELNTVLLFIRHDYADKVVKENAHLSDELNLDSLDVMDFIARCELFYRIEIGDENIELLFNLGLIADFIGGKLDE